LDNNKGEIMEDVYKTDKQLRDMDDFDLIVELGKVCGMGIPIVEIRYTHGYRKDVLIKAMELVQGKSKNKLKWLHSRCKHEETGCETVIPVWRKCPRRVFRYETKWLPFE
jgi:hypothetical protein